MKGRRKDRPRGGIAGSIDETVEGDAIVEDRQSQAEAPIASKRSIARSRRRSARIVEGVVRDVRPDALTVEIERLVRTRCEAEGAVVPSRRAIVAKVAEVRRFEPTRHLLILDRCLVTFPCGSGRGYATLHAAILAPPGRVVAWRVVAGPPLPEADAALLAEVQATSGPHPDTRVRLSTRGVPADRISHALAEAGVETTRPIAPIGRELVRSLGRRAGGAVLLFRIPARKAGARWLAPASLAELVKEIGTALDGTGRTAGPVPPFGLAPPLLAEELVLVLRSAIGRAATPLSEDVS